MMSHPTEQALFNLFEHATELRAQRAEQLWQSVLQAKANPVTAGNRALFLHWSDAQKVQLAGDWTCWQPSMPLTRVADTQLHYTILEFPDAARLQYKLIVDGRWQLDPANARIVEEGFGYNNEFWMPRYVDRSFLDVGRPVPSGTVEKVSVESSLLASHREVFFYVPALQLDRARLLIVHDGEEAIRIGKFPQILDNLHALGLIEAVVACFVTPRDRNREYASDEAYVAFTATELLPAARRYFERRGITIPADPAAVAVSGASLGGLLATRTALEHPELIGNVHAQSPSYWWNRGEIFRTPLLRNARKLRVVIQSGTICDAHELASLMARRLRRLGARVDYFEHPQGHTWGNWRSTFAEGICALFGTDSV